jgi:hypothetical protein
MREVSKWDFLPGPPAFNADGQHLISPYEIDDWMYFDAADGWVTFVMVNDPSRSSLVLQWKRDAHLDKDYLSLDGKAERGWLVYDWSGDPTDKRKERLLSLLQDGVADLNKAKDAYVMTGSVSAVLKNAHVRTLNYRKLETRDSIVPPRQLLLDKILALDNNLTRLRVELAKHPNDDSVRQYIREDEARKINLLRVLDGDTFKASFGNGKFQGYGGPPRFRLPFP